MRSQKFKKLPDKTGHFGIYGGRYISETLMPVICGVKKSMMDRRPARHG